MSGGGGSRAAGGIRGEGVGVVQRHTTAGLPERPGREALSGDREGDGLL